MLSKLRLRIMLITQVLWLATICILGAWWGKLALKQAEHIAELEKMVGLSPQVIQEHWLRTQRMLFWESATFFILLVAVTIFLFWLYWRDVKRIRGIQAFFASVTHELRTPLTSIRLQAESIAENLSQVEPIGEHSKEKHLGTLLSKLLEDTSRLEGQVERTLELARIEGGGSVFTRPFQLRPWTEWFVKTWNENHWSIHVTAKVEDHMIQADMPSMHIILKNLLENSLRHSKSQNLNVALLTPTCPTGWVVLQYLDNGKGFNGDPQNLGKLFYKGPDSQGAGVGLYLVSALMKRMGGWAQFKSGSSGFETQLWFKKNV